MTKISPLNEVAVEAEEHKELRAFLGEIKLEKHVAAMVQAGYDDVDFLKDLDADSLERLRVALTAKEVPDGHVDRIVHHVKGRTGTGTAPVPQQMDEKPPEYIREWENVRYPVTWMFGDPNKPRPCQCCHPCIWNTFCVMYAGLELFCGGGYPRKDDKGNRYWRTPAALLDDDYCSTYGYYD